MTRFSSPVRFSSTAAYWPARPIRGAQRARVADDVEAGDARRAGVGRQQRGEDAHRGRLAGAVGAEHAEHGAGRGLEVDAVERAHVAERLDEAARPDRRLAAGFGSSACVKDPTEQFRSVSVLNSLGSSRCRERDHLEPPADAALAAAGPARLAGRRARRPARGLRAHDPPRRRAPARARLSGRVADRPGGRLPAAAGHGDAAAAARRRRGDRDRGRAAHRGARVGDRHRGDLGARARQARAGAARRTCAGACRRSASATTTLAAGRRPDRRPAGADR